MSLRAWLGTLARVLRSDQAAAHPVIDAPKPVWLFWIGLALLLAASASLEWTRLYQWEGRVTGGHAGGAVGYTLGSASQQWFGFAFQV